jgi:hypothetical protein
MKLISHNKSLYELRNLGNGFIGHVPSKVTITEASPSMRWTGAKIPDAVWKQIVSFFQWSYEETKSETQVRLMLNTDTGEFKAHAFPQKYGTGMTAKELSNNPDYERQLNEQMANGNWIKFGTAHHHCSTGAFQSGTDSADETEMGIHITLGNINSPAHTIHARVSLTIPGTLSEDGSVASKASHAYYNAVLSDWFHAPQLPVPLPENIREDIVKYQLCTPVPKDQLQFPPCWADNLIKEAIQPVAITPTRDYRAYYNGLENEVEWGVSRAAFAQPTPIKTTTMPVERDDFRDDELLEIMNEIQTFMQTEGVSFANIHGIMELANMGSHELSPEETAIFNTIDGMLHRIGMDWTELTYQLA